MEIPCERCGKKPLTVAQDAEPMKGHYICSTCEAEMELPPLPPKIACTGRTDIEHATFGIGGDRERTERAIREGYHTGFRQLPPKPPKFKVTGRTDLENCAGLTDEQRAMVQRAIDEGYSTGFRRLGKGRKPKGKG